MRDKWEDTLFQMAEREQMLMPREVSEQIEDILCKLDHGQDSHAKAHFRMNLKKSLLLAAASVMLVSATAAASAGAVRERMEAMNREKLEMYFAQIYASKIGVDNYNRPYTDGEKERLNQLRDAYENEARFPEGELTMIDAAGDYRGRGVAFLGDTSTFFFPEREMSDEELLRVIDFAHRRDYSLQKMNELIDAGEAQMPVPEEKEIDATDEEILGSDAVYEPRQALTIPYTGELELDLTVAAGRRELFLAGYNTVHRMEIGSSDSQLFFDDFDAETRVLAMCQDTNGDVYMALWQWQEDDEEDVKLALWVVSEAGELLRKIDMSPYIAADKRGYVGRMLVDGEGRLYLKAAGLRSARARAECEILVLDRQGDFVARIGSDEYALRRSGGMCVGKDGRVYTHIENYHDPEHPEDKMGIAAIDVERGILTDIHDDIMPSDAISLDIVAQGAENDFVLWGYNGIFTYDLGDEKAVCVLPAYEAPCDWEGVKACALPDGRIVFADSSEYRVEETRKGGVRVYGIPEKTCFYYMPGIAE